MALEVEKSFQRRQARTRGKLEMKYRDIDYTLIQGVGGHLWKWRFALDGRAFTGQAATKAQAVAEAERAIDGALNPKKFRLIPSDLE